MNPRPPSDPHLETVATFDHHADRYADKYFGLSQYHPHYDWLVDELPDDPPTVLDLACGPGNVSAHVRRRRPDARVIGVDRSERMLDQARARVPGIETFCMDCRDISKLAGHLESQLDAAAFFFGLSYLDEQAAQDCLESLLTLIRPTGLLLLATVTGDPARSGVQTSTSGHRVHMVYRRPEAVRDMLEQCFYEILKYEVIESPSQASEKTADVVILAQVPFIDFV